MKKINSIILSVIIFIAGIHHTASGQISVVPFVNNVFKVTDITNCGDDRLFIVEQAGRIRIADLNGNLLPDPFLSITARVNDSGAEQGLLGMAFSPLYIQDGRFYVNYTNSANETVIARYKVSATNPDIADSVNEEILFTVAQPYTNHNGGTMQFGPDGYLYMGLGDGGAGGDPGNRAQNLHELLGKILRIDVNTINGFKVPESNPFYGSGLANPMIWAYGLRNPWRMSFDKYTGDLWIGDVGQLTWEEVDVQPASSKGGENYGWRCYEGNAVYDSTCNFPLSRYTPPVFVYPHNPGCSITGGYVYRGAKHASWFGKYFFTDFCAGRIQTLTPQDTGGYVYEATANFGTTVFSTFGLDRYGELYIGKNTSGVLKMMDSSCVPVAFISENDTIIQPGQSHLLSTPYAPGLIYQWILNGAVLPGANNNTFQATLTGNYQVFVSSSDSCRNLSRIATLILGNPDGFDIYPNPANDFTELVWSEGAPSKKKVEIFDVTGKVCVKNAIPDQDLRYSVNTKSLSKGIYIVRMTINGKDYFRKLMINQ